MYRSFIKWDLKKDTHRKKWRPHEDKGRGLQNTTKDCYETRIREEAWVCFLSHPLEGAIEDDTLTSDFQSLGQCSSEHHCCNPLGLWYSVMTGLTNKCAHLFALFWGFHRIIQTNQNHTQCTVNSYSNLNSPLGILKHFSKQSPNWDAEGTFTMLWWFG